MVQPRLLVERIRSRSARPQLVHVDSRDTLDSMARSSTRKASGARGPKGHRGERGERGEPGIAPQVLAELITTVEALRAESEIQLRRIADLQAQLDITLAHLKHLGSRTH